MGYIYAGKEDYDATIASFERAIATGDLPPRVVSDLTYGFGAIAFGERPTAQIFAID